MRDCGCVAAGFKFTMDNRNEYVLMVNFIVLEVPSWNQAALLPLLTADGNVVSLCGRMHIRSSLCVLMVLTACLKLILYWNMSERLA